MRVILARSTIFVAWTINDVLHQVQEHIVQAVKRDISTLPARGVFFKETEYRKKQECATKINGAQQYGRGGEVQIKPNKNTRSGKYAVARYRPVPMDRLSDNQ